MRQHNKKTALTVHERAVFLVDRPGEVRKIADCLGTGVGKSRRLLHKTFSSGTTSCHSSVLYADAQFANNNKEGYSG